MFSLAERRDQLAMAHQEDVAAGALGHVAGLGQENGLVETVVPRLVAGQHAVDVRSADLAAAGNGVILDAPPRTYARMQALGAVQIGGRGQGHNGEGVLVVDVDADPLGRLVGQRLDVNVAAKPVAPHHVAGELDELGGGERHLDAQDAAVLLPAQKVLPWAHQEQLILTLVPIPADALEDARPEIERMRENTHPRLG